MNIDKNNPELKEILKNSISENDSEFKDLDLNDYLKIKVTAKNIESMFHNAKIKNNVKLSIKFPILF